MSSFLTQEEVRAVRLKDSVKYRIERLGKEVLIVLVSGDAAFEIRDRQLADDGGTPKGQRETFKLMIKAAVAAPDGTPLTSDDAQTLLEVLPLNEVTDLIAKVNANLGIQAGKAKASQAATGASSTDSAASSAGPTPIT